MNDVVKLIVYTEKGSTMKNLESTEVYSVGPVYTNCYFLKNKVTGEMIVIDPADCHGESIDAEGYADGREDLWQFC